VDLDGTPAYEFVKWRAKQRAIKCGFTLSEEYDFVLMMDVIEHIADWKGPLSDIVGCMKPGAILATNYFSNVDYDNAEHISMDKKAVRDHLLSLEMYPQSAEAWIKGTVIPDGK
jgi:2-polyprenyl-3-methyl-5-hydroxy-6-metoxy-1,4-benzoquinol methylase